MNNLIPRLEFIAQSFLKKQPFCPHCHSKNLSNLDQKYGVVNIKTCNDCNLCFTDPIYKPLFISNLYEKIYDGEGSTTVLPKFEELNSLISNNFASFDKNFYSRIQLIKSCCLGTKMLEIGSSWGYFLYQAKQQGFDVTGVEISERRRLFGIKNLDLDLVGSISELDGRIFDIVYTAHTLEHFTDLSTVFRAISNLLHIKGQLLIEVQNFDYAEFGKKALSAVGAVHPLGFSSEFFQENLPKYGFKVLGFYNSWDSFPHHPVSKSQQDVIIVMAEKEF